MRTTVLTALGAALIAVATTQLASAQDVSINRHHHARKVEQFRNANNAVVVVQPSTPEIYSGGWSAPAGR
ncbi:MAG: hypothetical protein JO141_28520 [Bradyrhizobium sp.]|nr:hypothetical protein [Bradyrhizobium sp.]